MPTHIWGKLRGNLVKAIFLRTKLWLKLLLRKTFTFLLIFYSTQRKFYFLEKHIRTCSGQSSVQSMQHLVRYLNLPSVELFY